MNDTIKRLKEITPNDTLITAQILMLKYKDIIYELVAFSEKQIEEEDGLLGIVGASFQTGYQIAKQELKEKKN